MPATTATIRRRMLWIALSVILIAPAIGSDFLNDDYFFNSPIHQVDAPFGYYDFLSNRNVAMAPWWTSDEFQVRFFRPLASLTLHLDVSLFADNALPGHLHSALWLIILLLGAFAVFDRLLDHKTQRIAEPLFGLGLFTAWAAGWMSARHAIMGGTFAVWATVFFVDGLRTEKRRPMAISMALFVLGLLSSESALPFAAVALFFVVAHKDQTRERIRFLLAPLLFGGAYILFYKLAGYGARGSDLYVDPLSAPVDYLAALPSKMMALLGSFTFGIPAMLRIVPNTEVIAVTFGVLALITLVGLTLLRRPVLDSEQKKRVSLLFASFPVAMLPEMSGMVEGRGSLLAGVLFCALSATLLQGAFTKTHPRRHLCRFAAGVLFTGMLILSPLSRLGASIFIYMGAANLTRIGQNANLGCARGQDIYQINADSLMAVMYPFVAARYQGRFFNHWNQLGQAPRDLTLTRTGEETVRLEAKDGIVESYLWLFRKPTADWQQDTPMAKDNLRATIIEKKKHTPTIVEFNLKGLQNDGVCLLRADGFLLKQLTIPPIGKSVVVPWVPPQP
ncbi:MAG: glycosyltransferase family 39 protein [Deltaproteobacteria bacterium]|nr:glycosyltransferase family 39 protein [Deltaproteobacteria bacterium]